MRPRMARPGSGARRDCGGADAYAQRGRKRAEAATEVDRWHWITVAAE